MFCLSFDFEFAAIVVVYSAYRALHSIGRIKRRKGMNWFDDDDDDDDGEEETGKTCLVLDFLFFERRRKKIGKHVICVFFSLLLR